MKKEPINVQVHARANILFQLQLYSKIKTERYHLLELC